VPLFAGFVLQLTSELSCWLSSSSDRSTLTSSAAGVEMLRVEAPGFEDRRSAASLNSGNVQNED